ncbi:hypothetical protein [uncultured Gimesia sp.]|uniref:hypothetical protein n=1 Tax=uncultured Gimesia sp. TaxID=1678688 RepID=UPI0026349F65|nr:hypothetical protein [uncultured Gimesia sp.]
MNGGFLDDAGFSDSRDQISDAYSIDDLLFVSFNSRVIALNRDTGNLLWSWKSSKGRSNMVLEIIKRQVKLCRNPGR